MPTRQNRRAAASVGREFLLDTAADLLGTLTWKDVASSLGPQRLASAADCSPGTVTHHFPTNAELLPAALHHALDRLGMQALADMSLRLEEEGAALAAGEVDGLEAIERALAAELATYSPDDGQPSVIVEAEETAYFLAVAVAPRDEVARAELREYAAELKRDTQAQVRRFLDQTGLRLIDEVLLDSLALTINLLAAGFLVHRRIDREGCPLALYADMTVRLFSACTAPNSLPSPTDPKDFLVPTPPTSQRDRVKRDRIAYFAELASRERSWPDVTISAVAHAATVSRPTVLANFGDKNGLAAAVWATRYMPSLQAGAEQDLNLPLIDAIFASLERLAHAAQLDRLLTAAMLEGVFAYTVTHGRPKEEDEADPRNLAKLPHLLVPIVAAGADHFRPGMAETEREQFDTAAMLTNHALNLTMTRGMTPSRPGLTPREVAAKITDTTLAGMLKVRPKVRRAR